MIFGLDRHYYPVDIPAGANIRINSTNVSLTEGTYYSHNSSFFPAGFLSFYAHLRTRLSAVLGGTWSVDPIRPSGYSLTSGVRLSVTGITGVNLDLSATTAVVRQLLGFAQGDTSVVAFVSNRIEGPYAAYGSWCPWSCFDGRASSKDSFRSRQMSLSSDEPEDAVATTWRSRRTRLMRYPLVYGATVYGNRAGVQVLADQAGTALGDANNTLDNLWAAVGSTPSGVPQPGIRPVLITHDATDLDLQILSPAWDTAIMADLKGVADLSDLATRNGLASDLWDVNLPYILTGGFYGL